MFDRFAQKMSGKAAAAFVKPHVPAILITVVEAIITDVAGEDHPRCCASLWVAKRSDGSDTVMASVHRLTELDEPGEELGTIDVLKRADNIDFSKFIQDSE